jgi:hypothetical protein
MMTKKRNLVAAILASLAISATAAAAPRSASEQIGIFSETVNSGQEGGWFVSPEKDANWNRWFYAVTDLDHDGRLEIFKAKRGGDGIAPEVRCEELNESGEGRSWGLFLAGGSDIPNIMTGEASANPAVIYEQENNDYHYIFMSSKQEDGDEWDFTDTKVALTLHGDLIVEELAMMKVKLPEPGSDLATRKFFLPAWLGVEAESGQTGTPEEIDVQQYADVALARFGADKTRGAEISWYRAEEIQKIIGLADLPQVLEKSYGVFARSNNQ